MTPNYANLLDDSENVRLISKVKAIKTEFDQQTVHAIVNDKRIYK